VPHRVTRVIVPSDNSVEVGVDNGQSGGRWRLRRNGSMDGGLPAYQTATDRLKRGIASRFSGFDSIFLN
jgi:hypothetical protein